MKHRGKTFEEVVRQSGMSLMQMAERLGVSRLTLYNYFGYEQLNWDIILNAGRIINHDFSIEFPELRNMVHEPQEDYSPAKDDQIEKLKLEKEKYQEKLIKALETIDELREENHALKEKLQQGGGE